MRPFLLLLPLLIGGCALTGTAVFQPAKAGGAIPAYIAEVPTLGAEEMGLGGDQVTSRASLVHLDRKNTCFDLLIRRPALLPRDHVAPPLEVTVSVDGDDVIRTPTLLQTCAWGLGCLPADSPLVQFEANDDTRVEVEGQRLCFPALPAPRREVVLSANPGIGAYRFRFLVGGDAG